MPGEAADSAQLPLGHGRRQANQGCLMGDSQMLAYPLQVPAGGVFRRPVAKAISGTVQSSASRTATQL